MPRTLVQNEELKEQRKKKIEKAALRLFAKNEFHEISVDNITSLSRCSHGLFYHYYHNQEELFQAIEKDIMTREDGKYWIDFSKLEQKNAENGFHSFLCALKTIFNGERDVIYYYAALARNDFSLEKIPSAYYKESDKSSFCNLIGKAMECGCIKQGDPEEIMRLFFLIISANLSNIVQKKKESFSLETLKRIF